MKTHIAAGPWVQALLMAACLVPSGPAAAVDMPPAEAVAPVDGSSGRRCEKPDYPPEAMAARAEGITRLKVTLGPDGLPRALSIEKPSGSSREHRLLDRAAADHVARCLAAFAKHGPGGSFTVEYVWQHGLPAAAASSP